MGRILPITGAAFRPPALQREAAGPTPGSRELGVGDVADILKLAEAIGGSRAVGALVGGLTDLGGVIGRGAASLFEPDPDPGLSAAIRARGMDIDALRAGLAGIRLAPAPRRAAFPGDAPDAPDAPDAQAEAEAKVAAAGIRMPSELSPLGGIDPASKLPVPVPSPFAPTVMPFQPPSLRGGVPNLQPPGGGGDVASSGTLFPDAPLAPAAGFLPAPGSREAVLADVQGRVEAFLRSGGSALDAVQALVGRGASQEEATAIVRAARGQVLQAGRFAEVTRQATAPPPPDLSPIITALQVGSPEAEIESALAARELLGVMGGREPEAADVFDRARATQLARDRIAKARKFVPAPPPAPALPVVRTLDEALALAARAATPQEREAAVRAVAGQARPQTLFDMVSGEHRLRAIDQARRLFPKEFAAAQPQVESPSLVAGREALTERRLREEAEAKETFGTRKATLEEGLKGAQERREFMEERRKEFGDQVAQRAELLKSKVALVRKDLEIRGRTAGLRPQDFASLHGRIFDQGSRALVQRQGALLRLWAKGMELSQATGPTDAEVAAAPDARARSAMAAEQVRARAERSQGESILAAQTEGRDLQEQIADLDAELARLAAATVADIASAAAPGVAAPAAVPAPRKPGETMQDWTKRTAAP